MLNNKKKVLLYSSIILLILFGVYYTVLVEGVAIATRNLVNTYANASFELNTIGNTRIGVCAPFTNKSDDCNATYGDLPNWTRGGNTETFIFVINISNGTFDNSGRIGLSSIDNNNVTAINITVPGNTSSAGAYSALVRQGDASNFTNASYVGWSILGGGWGGLPSNNSPLSTMEIIIRNTTAIHQVFVNTSGVNLSSGAIGPRGGTEYNNREVIYIAFNATARNGTEEVLNWTILIYNSTGRNEAAATLDNGLGLLTGIDGLPPRSNTTNVTDSENTRTSFSGTQYLKYDQTSSQQGINITLSVNDYNLDRVLLVYNNTGGSLNLDFLRSVLYNSTFLNFSNIPQDNFTVLEKASTFNGVDSSKANISALGSIRSALGPTAPGYVFSFNISNVTWGEGATDGTEFRYVFVVYDLYNHSEIINNSNAEYVLARDVNKPSVTLTEPLDTTIGTFDPIKYTCGGSDTSGLASCTTKMTKPGSSTITKTGCSTEHTFTGDDTNEAGTYTVDCTLKDNVQRSASKSVTFTASAGGGGVSAGAGVGGGGGSSREEAIEVPTGVTGDLGTLTTTNVYTSVSKDGRVSFVVAGSSHTATVLEVTADSATIEVSSTPSQFILTVGQSQEVDVDDNGVNDLIVTLSSITDSKADLIFKSTEAAAPPAEEAPEEEVITGEEVKPSLTWLWVVIVIVVVVLLIWYFSRRKR